jgi:glycosyltransferase involved in cell wall biosynthesis
MDVEADEPATETLERAIIVCDLPEEALAGRAKRVLERLARCMARAPAGVVFAAAPEARQAPVARKTPSTDERCTRLKDLLEASGLHVDFVGSFPGFESSERSPVAILAGRGARPPGTAPEDFQVVAIVPAYNEADIIAPSLEALIRQGLLVYLLDNWSSDGTERIASRYLGRGVIHIERFPSEGRQNRYELARLLQRITELDRALSADWIVVNDADEVRESPWPGVSLRDAIFTADRRGFNAIDHTVLSFEPTDDGFPDGGDLGYFRHFHFGSEPWHFLRINTWKRSGNGINLVDSGGHEAQFEGRRVFPYKFLLKHYGVRSQRHGVKKVFLERKARFDEAERARGWHVHYDQILAEQRFLHDSRDLLSFDPRRFDRDFLIERLSGIGIPRTSPSPSFRMSEDIARPDSDPIEGRSGILEVDEKVHAGVGSGGRDSIQGLSGSYAVVLGDLEAQLADLKLRVQESHEREQRLIDRAFEAEEKLADELSTEHELRTQIARYAELHQALQRSKPWKMVQFFRRLLGREW